MRHRPLSTHLARVGMTALLVARLQGTAADAEFLLGFGADPTVEGDVWLRNQFGGEGKMDSLQPAKVKVKGTLWS